MKREDRINIQENNPQWKDVVFQIQLATGCASIQMLSVQRYPILVDRSLNDPSIRGIVDATDLKKHFKQMVIEKHIPLQEVIFICGHINLQRYHSESNKVFSFLVCQVAVGNIALNQESFQYADSMLIEPNSQDPFHYNLLLKTYKQYQVKYECQFMIGDPRDVARQPPMCYNCGVRKATVYCRDQRKSYCNPCSDQQHYYYDRIKGHQIPNTHRLQPITRNNSLPVCQIHRERHELYCTKCEKYLCPECLRQPPHTQNDDHPTRPIQYLYSEKRQANARMPIKTQQKLAKLLQMAKQKQKNVLSNYKQVKNAIVTEFEKAMADLEKMHQQRLYLVQSDIIRMELELDRLEWNFSFLNVQEQVLKPVHYFRLQSRFEKDMKQIKTTGFFGIEVQPDIDQYSFIRVGDKRTIGQLKQSLSRNKQNWQATSNFAKERNQEVRKKAQRLLTYDPDVPPHRKGDLTLLIQNNKPRFFKGNYMFMK